MRSRRLVPAFLAGCTLLLSVGAPSALAAPLTGVQVTPIYAGVSTATVRRQLDQAKGTGASTVRTDILWSELEPDGAGRHDAAYLKAMDTFFGLARQRRLRVVATVLRSPCWASFAPDSERGNCGEKNRTENVSRYPPRDAADYGAVVKFVAARYRNALYAVEVWNEPDHSNEAYFAGPEKPKRYAAILKAAFAAVDEVSPQTLVLGGSIVGANGRFLEALYREGIKGHYDALSVHYYDLVLASVRSIRAVQARNGDTKPLWIGEFGWTDCFPRLKRQGGHDCVSSRIQAQSIRDVLAAIRRTSYIKGAVVYNLLDDKQYDFGLIDERGRLKSAYAALKHVVRRTPAPRAVRLKVRRTRGRVVASGSGPAGDAYELDVFKDGYLRYRRVFRLRRDLSYSYGIPRSLGTRGLQVQVYQYWLGARKGTARRL